MGSRISLIGVLVSSVVVTLSPAVISGSPAGKYNRIAFGVVILVVKMKKVIRRNPRSTIGVRSTRVDNFLVLRTPARWGRPAELLISAINDCLIIRCHTRGFPHDAGCTADANHIAALVLYITL